MENAQAVAETVTPPAWVGWYRQSVAARRVWKRAAEGPSEPECFRALLQEVAGPDYPRSIDLVVLPTGVKP